MTASVKNDRQRVRRLLDIVVRDPSSFPNLTIREIDLALRLTRRVRLLGRLGADLDAAGLLDSLPPTAAEQLRSGMVLADSRSRLALWELDRIAWTMRTDSSTALVALKGCAYLLLDLPNARGRLFADVDILTSERQLVDVESTLNANGWISTKVTPYDQNYYRKWTHELPPLIHEEREVEIDLHHNILPRTARLNPVATELLGRSRQLPGSRYRVLANEDIVLHAMTHLMFDGDLADKLRDLVDIDDLLTYFSAADSDFWHRLMNRAVELDLTRPAYYSIRFTHLMLDATVPDAVVAVSRKWAPPGMIVWLMDRLVQHALYPQHPDRPSKISRLYRLMLYMRSHWIRMPPWLLVYHLGYKFCVTRIRRPKVHR